eukprot:6885719-Alexandrium_andersonii.AAC.1
MCIRDRVNDVRFTSAGGRVVNRKTQRTIGFTQVDGIYVLEMLLAPPRADAAVGASCQTSERSGPPDELGGSPSEG